MYRKIPLSIEVPKVLKLLMYTLLSMLTVSSAYFFVKMSGNAKHGYLLKENQIRSQELESENRILKQKVLDVQSLTEVKMSQTVKKMEEPKNPIYVAPPAPLTKRKTKNKT